MTALTIVIPAAGSASRMRGGDKLLERVDGQPLLRRQVTIALATGLPTIVTLRPDDPARQSALIGLPVQLIEVADAATGMSASLRAAARAVSTALMILPADMPDLTEADLRTLIAAFDQDTAVIQRGASGATPGHPVILPAQYLTEIARLSGDEGARSILPNAPVRLVPLPEDHATTDLDTPEDWAAWRNRRSGATSA